MFNFLKKIVGDADAGLDSSSGDHLAEALNPLERAIARDKQERSKESFGALFPALSVAELYTLNSGGDRLVDMAVVVDAQGIGHGAVYTTRGRAEAAAQAPYGRVDALSVLELVLNLNEEFGLIFNSGDPQVSLKLNPQILASFRRMLERSYQLGEGELYAVFMEGCYRLLKVLKLDDAGVHFCLYSGGWEERPLRVAPEDLTLSNKAGEAHTSIGHLPFTRRGFLAMGPQEVSTPVPLAVTDAELEGYRMWEEAKGGYFGQ